jgi:glutaredoxin
MVYVNDQYRLIFIENPKTASTALLKALERALKVKIKREVSPALAHLTVDQVKHKYADKWESYLKVSTHRDPFKRFCSSINFQKHQQKSYKNHEQLVNHLKNPRGCPFCKKQEEFTKECDFLVHLETIQADFDTLCSKLNVQPVKVERENVSNYRKRSLVSYNYKYLYDTFN